MKKLTKLEDKIRESGKSFFDEKTKHLQFTQPLIKPRPWYRRWALVVPPLGAIAASLTVMVAILIGTTQPNNSFDQAFTGIFALNQVTFPPIDQRNQSEDFLGGMPSYTSYQQGVETFFQRTAQSIFQTDENVVYSPLSAYVALALLLEAANGETYDALAQLLQVNDIQQFRQENAHAFIDTYLESELTLQSTPTLVARSRQANGVFVKEGITVDPQYLDLLANQYFAEIFQTDFASEARDDIARWLNQRTFDFLKMQPEDLSFNQDTVISLFNTLYLKANWKKAYDASQNTQQSFRNTATGQLINNVTYMHKQTLQTLYIDQPSFTLGVDEAYGDHRVIYVLPKDDLTPVQLLSAEYFPLIQAAIRSPHTNESIAIALPKNAMQNKLDLKEHLITVSPEMAGLFDPMQADLSKALPDTYVQSLMQHSRLDFFEAGFEAAAITEANVGTTSAPGLPTVQLVLNRSFLYLIVNRQGLVLFSGVVNQPTY
jgi:serine protease inhibitor